jgi:hypothetical protein
LPKMAGHDPSQLQKYLRCWNAGMHATTRVMLIFSIVCL